ncbi:glycosyltransferase family 4 protein [Billgrantia sp. Q4P2]|uniref:glycosyltransferase family 4 protein n=1 Tax=Billgrantia sp. Q4P2 TaxID=3463857 RepID=UPI0040565B40
MNAFKKNNPLKVLFPYPGDSVGGSHISSLILAQALENYSDIKVQIVLHHQGKLETYLKDMPQSYQFSPKVNLVSPKNFYKEVTGIVKAAWPLRNYLKKNMIDIVHTNDIRMHLTWLLACRLAGCKMVWHQRTPSKNYKLAFYSLLAAQVLTISKHCLCSLPKRMAQTAKIIHNPVVCYKEKLSRSEAKKKLLEEVNANPHTVIVGWAANWENRKKPDDLVRVAYYVKNNTNLSVRFLMFGEARDPLGSTVNDLIEKLDLLDIVIPMGMKTPIEPYLMGCDLFLATAVNEGLGRTLIEAMICKTPVIATEDGGHKEIIQDGVNGRLVPPENPEAMGDLVLDFIKKPSVYNNMAESTAEAAINRFSVKVHAEEILKVYRGL